MAWTVTFKKLPPSNVGGFRALTGSLIATSDDGSISQQNFEIQYPINDAIIADMAKRFVDRLTSQDAIFAALTEGPVTPKLIVPVPPTPPTQQQIDIQTFVNAYVTLTALQKAMDSGIDTVTQKDIDEAAVAYKTAYQPGFEKFIPR